jgi:hypothetical protein
VMSVASRLSNLEVSARQGLMGECLWMSSIRLEFSHAAVPEAFVKRGPSNMLAVYDLPEAMLAVFLAETGNS